MKRLAAPALVSLVVGLALAALERGSGPATLLVFFLVVVVGAPALVVFAVTKRDGRIHSLARVALVFMVVQCLVFPLGFRLREQDIRAARAYCDSITLRLEAEKQTRGVYPDGIETLIPKGPPPRLVAASRVYTGRQDQYELSFSVGGVLFPHLHRYQSETCEWEILD